MLRGAARFPLDHSMLFDIDSQIGLMHTLFALEDIYGLTVCETGGEVCLHVNKDKCKAADDLLQMLTAWQG